jgi:hypothetical protein
MLPDLFSFHMYIITFVRNILVLQINGEEPGERPWWRAGRAGREGRAGKAGREGRAGRAGFG